MILAHLTVLRLITSVWTKTSKTSYLSEFSAQVDTNRVLSSFDRFTAYYYCMSYNLKSLISAWVQCKRITNRVLSSFDRFTVYYNFRDVISKFSYVSEFSAQISQIVFIVHFTVLRLNTTVWTKTSKISYLSEFSSQISQIVFLAHLTVLRLIASVLVKISKLSYLREFSAQMSQMVFLAHFTVLRLITTVWARTSKVSYFKEFSAQVSQIVFLGHLTVLWFYYNCMN